MGVGGEGDDGRDDEEQQHYSPREGENPDPVLPQKKSWPMLGLGFFCLFGWFYAGN